MDDPRSPLIETSITYIGWDLGDRDSYSVIMTPMGYRHLFGPEADERAMRVERLRRLRRKKHKTKPKTVGKWRARKSPNFHATFGKKRPSKAWRRHVRRSKQER